MFWMGTDAQAEVGAVVAEMVDTMFKERNPATHAAATADKNGAQELQCRGIAVSIRDKVRLSGMTVQARIESACAPIGPEGAQGLCDVLCRGG